MLLQWSTHSPAVILNSNIPLSFANFLSYILALNRKAVVLGVEVLYDVSLSRVLRKLLQEESASERQIMSAGPDSSL